METESIAIDQETYMKILKDYGKTMFGAEDGYPEDLYAGMEVQVYFYFKVADADNKMFCFALASPGAKMRATPVEVAAMLDRWGALFSAARGTQVVPASQQEINDFFSDTADLIKALKQAKESGAVVIPSEFQVREEV